MPGSGRTIRLGMLTPSSNRAFELMTARMLAGHRSVRQSDDLGLEFVLHSGDRAEGGNDRPETGTSGE